MSTPSAHLPIKNHPHLSLSWNCWFCKLFMHPKSLRRKYLPEKPRHFPLRSPLLAISSARKERSNNPKRDPELGEISSAQNRGVPLKQRRGDLLGREDRGPLIANAIGLTELPELRPDVRVPLVLLPKERAALWRR